MIKFEWDRGKDRSNQRKHGVSFEEAQSVFFDENAIQFYDEDHSEAEDRFIMLGRPASAWQGRWRPARNPRRGRNGDRRRGVRPERDLRIVDTRKDGCMNNSRNDESGIRM